METTYVYVISQESLGDVYVGITNHPAARWAQHKCGARKGRGKTSKLYNSMRKYGEDSFRFRVIAACEQRVSAQLAEIALIKLKQPKCNITPGGEGAIGWVPNEEQRKARSERMLGNTNTLGRKLTPEHKAKINARGRKHSEETKAKIGASHRGMKYATSKPRSAEAKLKTSLKLRANAIAKRLLKEAA